MNGNEITLSFAKEALKPYISLKKKTITIDGIQEFIAKKYSIKVADLKLKNNRPKIALPRQIAMYICKKLTRNSLAEIGSKFGGKHHTTVLHSIKKIENEIKVNEDFSKQVTSFLNFFQD